MQTRVTVTHNGERIWSDGLPGRSVAVCGNLRFAAVALQGGLLQVCIKSAESMHDAEPPAGVDQID